MSVGKIRGGILVFLLLCGLTALFAQETPYTIDTQDVLSVVVARHDALAGEYEVPPNGRVVFHGAGEIEVRGLTLEQIAERLAERLKARLKNPDVTVSLKKARPLLVFVEGKVNKPGAYPILPGWRVFEAISTAEGLSVPPERAHALLIRGSETTPLDLASIYHRGDPKANLILKPGDKISVQEHETIRVFVSGLVEKPSPYDIDTGRGAVEALTAAGGAKPEAALSRAVIMRRDQVIPVDLHRAVVMGDPSANIPLQANDTLVVPLNQQRCVVLGQVNKPIYIPLPDGKPFTLSDAYAMASGGTKRAITSKVNLYRLKENQVERREVPFLNFLTKGDPTANPVIQDGDVIVFSETRLTFDQVLGLISPIALLKSAGFID